MNFVQGHVTTVLMKQGSYHYSNLKNVLEVVLHFLMPVTGGLGVHLMYKAFNCKLRNSLVEHPCYTPLRSVRSVQVTQTVGCIWKGIIKERRSKPGKCLNAIPMSMHFPAVKSVCCNHTKRSATNPELRRMVWRGQHQSTRLKGPDGMSCADTDFLARVFRCKRPFPVSKWAGSFKE